MPHDPLLTHDERLALADPATPVAQERALDLIEQVRRQLDGAG